MKKIIIVEWDMQLGPNPLIQFPPEENYPPKEILLKIWTHHEMNPESNFISLLDPENFFCSLLKRDKNRTFFIILELFPNVDMRIYQEILENVAKDLIKNIDNPQFPHILSDTFKTIKNYAALDEDDLLLKLFEDPIRIAILTILQHGAISKNDLQQELEEHFGYTNLNLDLFLTPFLRLGLITIQDVPGKRESIFLINDLYSCRIPPENAPSNPTIEEVIINYFRSEMPIIPFSELKKVVDMFQKPGVKMLIDKLEIQNNEGTPLSHALLLLNDENNVIEFLSRELFITIENSDRVYLISKLHFFKFKPQYIFNNLLKRYKKNQISVDQLIFQVELLLEE